MHAQPCGRSLLRSPLGLCFLSWAFGSAGFFSKVRPVICRARQGGKQNQPDDRPKHRDSGLVLLETCTYHLSQNYCITAP